jgi:hypothetical protein
MPPTNQSQPGEAPETWEDPNDFWSALLVPTKRLNRDLRNAAVLLGDDEVRHLVDAYYAMQEDRKRSTNQVRALTEAEEPHTVVNWLATQAQTLESQIKVALDVYTENHVMGSWMREIFGIGPVISAGLLSSIHMGEWCHVCRGRTPEECQRQQANKKRNLPEHTYQPEFSCPTVGHIWAFAGWAADGQTPWEKGKRRPFNAQLKVLCWKAGQSFMKFSNDPKCFYGRIYKERKLYEMRRNEAGELAEQAKAGAARVGKTTEAYKHYSAGKLPPAHIDARARRYAVKLFLAHLHGEWYTRVTGNAPPLPYPVAHLNHTHIIQPPTSSAA